MTPDNRYQFVRELGRGGMGVVNLCFDTWLKREVAIKSVIRPAGEALQTWHETMQRLIREAQAAGSLRHPNIIAIYDILANENSPSIVMEFVRGKTLADAATLGQPADPKFTLEVLKQCAAALDHAHERGIVHRDVKPSNIMLDETGSVRLADFGVAKVLSSQTDLTHGMGVGTLEYMSPEQINAQAIDGRTDQYSLAVVAYRMLTGYRIFEADTLLSWCNMILTHSPLPPSQRVKALPPAVDAVLAKALSKQAALRYATCAEFVADLDRAFSLRPAPVATPEAVPDAAPPPRPAASEPPKATLPPAPPAEPRKRVPDWAIVAGATLLITVIVGTLVIHFSGGGQTHDHAAGKTTPSPTPVADTSSGPSAPKPPDSPAMKQGWTNPRDDAEYVYLAPATFTMGCVAVDKDCDPDETPHEVHLDRGFWIGRTEVTVAAYRKYSTAAGVAMPPAPQFNPNWSLDTHPIVMITWDDAKSYCEWIGGRLPSGAEWEYAARGGIKGQEYGMYNNDKPFAGDANYNGADRYPYTAPVRSFPPNGFGLFDMLGNAAEWVADGDGAMKAVRGGSWNVGPESLKISKRVLADPSRRNFTFGMRCAM